MGAWEIFLDQPVTKQIETALRAMREAVDVAGEDHVETKCVYMEKGQWVCLVGQVLGRLGMPKLNVSELTNGECIFDENVFPEIGTELRKVLAKAQDVQDGRADSCDGQNGTWGEAYRAALAVTPALV